MGAHYGPLCNIPYVTSLKRCPGLCCSHNPGCQTPYTVCWSPNMSDLRDPGFPLVTWPSFLFNRSFGASCYMYALVFSLYFIKFVCESKGCACSMAWTQCLSIFPAGRILLPLATEWSFIVMLSRPSHPVDLLSGWPEGVKIEAAISTSAKDKRFYGLIDSSIQSIFWLTSNIQSVGRVDKESTTISSLFRTRA